MVQQGTGVPWPLRFDLPSSCWCDKGGKGIFRLWSCESLEILTEILVLHRTTLELQKLGEVYAFRFTGPSAFSAMQLLAAWPRHRLKTTEPRYISQ